MKKRILSALFLASLVLLVSACSETDTGNPESNSAVIPEVSAVAEETAEETTATDAIKEMYSQNDLGGMTFTTIAPDASSHWIYSGLFNEVYASEYTGEIVNDKIKERNDLVQDLLNISLEFDMQSNIGGIASIVANNVTAGDTTYDLVLDTMTSNASNMLNMNLLNVRSIPTLDLTNRWWDKNQVDTFTLGGKLYWLCGDINIGDDYAVQVLYFNKNMLVNYNLENPYQAVSEGTWTFDRMYQMTTAVKNDTDGNGEMTLEDTWGLVEANDHIKHWLFAMGEKLMDKSEEEVLRMRCLDESHINTVDVIYDYFVNREMVYPGNVNNDVTSFTTGHTLFYSNQLYTLELLRDMDDEFGIIPMPKLNEQQESYGAYLSHGGATSFAVPVTNTDLNNTGVILEVLCGLSTDTLRSAFYDVLFSSKLVRDAESVASLDILLESKSYDWGVDFSWAGSFNTIYADMVTGKSNDLVSKARSAQRAVDKQLEKLTAQIAELP